MRNIATLRSIGNSTISGIGPRRTLIWQPMTTADHIPVIVGVGEFIDRPELIDDALEPLALWQKALEAASTDSQARLLEQLDSVELVGSVTWRYRNPVALLCERLGITPPRKINASMGGETPTRLVHEAALRISRGEISCAGIVGGEAMASVNRARKEHAQLPWSPLVSKEECVKVDGRRIAISDISRRLGITGPTQMYPLYEVAMQAEQGVSPEIARADSARLWEQYSVAASHNPFAWLRQPLSAAQIGEISPRNRMVSWPYPKLMMANPSVNQAAAIIVTSLSLARQLGVPSEKIIHIWGGAAAAEPDDYLMRDSYSHSTAQQATLQATVELLGGDAGRIDKLELYSCFPAVPKMALRTLGLDPQATCPTVAGGLTFFGGPLNNYMSHALCAMVATLRQNPGEVGMLYGQGGFFTKHHALIVSAAPPSAPLAGNYSVQTAADSMRGPVPELLEHYRGPARIETYTVLYDRDGAPVQGALVLRTPKGARTMARVSAESEHTMQLLISTSRSAVNVEGVVFTDSSGEQAWRPA
jgi:acetyl-CoA C-acetyltransferase